MVMFQDDVFDGGLATPVARSTLYDTVRVSSNTVVFENLQSQLKTREGAVTFSEFTKFCLIVIGASLCFS